MCDLEIDVDPVGRVRKGMQALGLPEPARCEIQWVDAYGKPTPDTNEAVGTVQCLGYPCRSNPAYVPEPSREFPICADHLLRMPDDGRWIFRPYFDEVAPPVTLKQALARSGDPSQPIGDRGAIQVFHSPDSRADYYRLSDFLVSSAVSGPSLVLVPRHADRKGGEAS